MLSISNEKLASPSDDSSIDFRNYFFYGVSSRISECCLKIFVLRGLMSKDPKWTRFFASTLGFFDTLVYLYCKILYFYPIFSLFNILLNPATCSFFTCNLTLCFIVDGLEGTFLHFYPLLGTFATFSLDIYVFLYLKILGFSNDDLSNDFTSLLFIDSEC